MKIYNAVGKRGENLATDFLLKNGYRILERNYRKKYTEIDIIAIDPSTKPKTLVFIEVKTRTSNLFGTPLEAITPWKIRSLTKTAYYLKAYTEVYQKH